MAKLREEGASDSGPKNCGAGGGEGTGGAELQSGICFHGLILLLSCKVLNVIILPFPNQEEKSTAREGDIHFIWHPATIIHAGCSLCGRGLFRERERNPTLNSF